MGRLPKLERHEVSPELQAIYDTYIKERGNVPNAFKVLSRVPSYLTTLIGHYRAVMFTGEIPFKLKELLFLHVSRLNACRY
ncbi:MAG TPA: hypothetical protein VGR38_12520 [Candidatus Polarisedimenticolia bacterium]|jgi:hypothetical protein|nr:hypothetical protein [Candidatus Polarisedimenticolia bacterium]